MFVSLGTSRVGRGGRPWLARGRVMALTQRVVRLSALRPWRVLAAWGLVVVASVAAIATLLGSAQHGREHHDQD